MNVLITGSFGFIGRNLSKWLFNRGYRLLALDVAKQQSEFYSECFTWDELDKIPFHEVSVVLHLAGIAHDLKKTTIEKQYFQVNYGLTKQIIDTLNSIPNSRPYFFLMSSVKACSNSFKGVMVEESPANPTTPYGKSKLAAEKYLLSNYSKAYVIRSCMVHGPGNKGNFNLLYKFSRTFLPWPLGAFRNQRSFLYIDNFCYIIEQFIKVVPEFGTYLVADDETISTNRLMALLRESRGKSSFILNIPPSLITTLCSVGEILQLPINSERLNKVTESFVVSNEKMKKALSIVSLPFTTENGFNATIKSLSSN